MPTYQIRGELDFSIYKMNSVDGFSKTVFFFTVSHSVLRTF